MNIKPFNDEDLRSSFKSLKRMRAPDSAVRALYRRLREGQPEPKSSARLLDFPGLKREVLITLVATILITVPLTFFLTKRFTSIKPIQKTYIVKLIYENRDAEGVYVIGDFNNWNSEGYGMKRIQGTNIWTVDISLEEGVYKYVFLIDNKEWVVDPFSQIKVKDNFGNESSLIVLSENMEDEPSL